jgi:hypothetical protein
MNIFWGKKSRFAYFALFRTFNVLIIMSKKT